MKKVWNIYFLLFDCVELLDFAGPFDVFSMANFGVAGKQPPCTEPGNTFKLHTVSEKGGTITALHGLRIETDYSFDNCPVDEIDLLIVPGFPPQAAEAFIAAHPDVIEWLRQRCEHVEIIGTVCVGALLVGKAGGFDGLEATSHHGALATLRKLAPLAHVIPGARYVDNELADKRRILSSAGVSAGMDLAFYILRYLIGGEKLALNTATIMEYNESANWVFGEVKPVEPDSLRPSPRSLPKGA